MEKKIRSSIDPLQSEPDLFCYERFEDWASKLRKRNVSDCQLEKKEERRMVVFDYIIPPPLLLLLRRRSRRGRSTSSSNRQLRVNFLIGLEITFTFLDIL